MAEGEIIQWNDERGFGFIQPKDGAERVFFHISVFPPGERPVVGQPVSFALESSPKGPRAKKIFLSQTKRAGHKRASAWAWVVPVISGFILFLAGAVLLRPMGMAMVIWYALVSLVTFAAYGWDKDRAGYSLGRMPEKNLHVLAVIGGWPGALPGQAFFRHKTRKASFRQVFWLTVGLNCLALMLAVLAGLGRQF